MHASKNHSRLLARTDVEEEHSEEYEQQVDALATQVLLVKEQCPKKERHNDTSPADHRDDANHRIGLAQGVEIQEVGRREKDADHRYAPMPSEGGRLTAPRPPEQEEHGQHHDTLVHVVPALNGHQVEPHATFFARSHEILVVEPAYCAEQGGEHDKINPIVVLEVDAFLLTATAEHQKGYHCQQHAYPLPHIQPLTKEDERTNEYHHGTGGVDGANDCQRQMLHAEIAEEPATEHDARLQHNVAVHLPPSRCHMEETTVEPSGVVGHNDERQKDKRREHRVEKQHRNHGIATQCLFLERVIATQ